MNMILKWYLKRVLSRPIVRAVKWTTEERNAFELFSRSACGIKLFEYLRQIVANTTFGSVYRNSVSANAHARGMQDLLGVLHGLRAFPKQEESAYGSLSDTEPAGQVESRDAWRFNGGRGAIG
jgi:hypothetical protein